jgi:hypothetical protein
MFMAIATNLQLMHLLNFIILELLDFVDGIVLQFEFN